MIEAERIGQIAARLAIADEAFLAFMLEAAERAGERMLPDDVASLSQWALFIRALRMATQADASQPAK